MYNNILWLIINIVVSILIIYFIHSGWIYIKDKYSTKKTKDLVNIQVNKYKQIINELQEYNSLKSSPINEKINENELVENMDDLLTNFMQNEL